MERNVFSSWCSNSQTFYSKMRLEEECDVRSLCRTWESSIAFVVILPKAMVQRPYNAGQDCAVAAVVNCDLSLIDIQCFQGRQVVQDVCFTMELRIVGKKEHAQLGKTTQGSWKGPSQFISRHQDFLYLWQHAKFQRQTCRQEVVVGLENGELVREKTNFGRDRRSQQVVVEIEILDPVAIKG